MMPASGRRQRREFVVGDLGQILMAGGWAMAPILICSAVALAIVLERCWTLRRASVLPPGLSQEVREWAQSAQRPELSRDFQLLDAFGMRAE